MIRVKMQKKSFTLLLLIAGATYLGSLFSVWICAHTYCYNGIMCLFLVNPLLLDDIMHDYSAVLVCAPLLLALSWPIVFWYAAFYIRTLTYIVAKYRVCIPLAVIATLLAIAPVLNTLIFDEESTFRVGYFISEASAIIGILLLPAATVKRDSK